MNGVHVRHPKRGLPWSRSAGSPNPARNSGPNPMVEICRTPIDHPSAWRSSDFASRDEFAIDLGLRHLQAFERALEGIRAAGLGLDDIDRRHFEVLEIAGDIAAWFDEVQHGRGFVYLRGFPVDRFSVDEIGMIYWGIGTHMGVGVSQSVLGDRLGHVMDFSADDPNARAYRNKQELDLHTDLSEIVAMLSLSKAKTGGLNQFCSTVTVHNEILANRPEYLEPLYRGFPYHRAGEEAPGEAPVTPWTVPVYSYLEGKLSARCVRGYITRGMAILDREMDALELAALDYLDEVARRPDVMLEFVLEPGEAMFYNNYLVMHARTAFEDDVEAGFRRHLLRLWLDVPGGRPAPKEMHIHSTAGIARQEGKTPTGEGDAYKAILSGAG